jgi:inner membrane protein
MILALFLLIPVTLVSASSQNAEFIVPWRSRGGGKWGRAQTITGPIVTIPVRQTFKDDKGKVQGTTIDYLHWLPEQLDITTSVSSQVRRRGIYKIVLYTLDLGLTADFQFAEIVGHLSGRSRRSADRHLSPWASQTSGDQGDQRSGWNTNPVPVDPVCAVPMSSPRDSPWYQFSPESRVGLPFARSLEAN